MTNDAIADIDDAKLPMNAEAPREKVLTRTLFGVFVWLLCLLLAGGAGGFRFGALEALGVFLGDVSPAVAASEGDPIGERGASHEDASDSPAHSDPEPAEELVVMDLRIELPLREWTEVSSLYFGKPRLRFSSPDPRPAEQV